MEDEKKQLQQRTQLCHRSKSRLQNLLCYSRILTCALNLKSTFYWILRFVWSTLRKVLLNYYKICIELVMFPKLKMFMIIEFFEFICIAKYHRSVFGYFCIYLHILDWKQSRKGGGREEGYAFSLVLHCTKTGLALLSVLISTWGNYSVTVK